VDRAKAEQFRAVDDRVSIPRECQATYPKDRLTLLRMGIDSAMLSDRDGRRTSSLILIAKIEAPVIIALNLQ